jgi:hypothetical protein
MFVASRCLTEIVVLARRGPADPYDLLPEIEAQRKEMEEQGGRRLERGGFAYFLGGRYYYVTLLMTYIVQIVILTMCHIKLRLWANAIDSSENRILLVEAMNLYFSCSVQCLTASCIGVFFIVRLYFHVAFFVQTVGPPSIQVLLAIYLRIKANNY